MAGQEEFNLMCEIGCADVVRELLKEDPTIDPAIHDNWAIQWASRHGDKKVIRVLLQDPRVDPSVNNNWPIRQASDGGYIEIVRLLLEHPRVDPAADNNSAFISAAECGYTRTIQLLRHEARARMPRIDRPTLHTLSTHLHPSLAALAYCALYCPLSKPHRAHFAQAVFAKASL